MPRRRGTGCRSALDRGTRQGPAGASWQEPGRGRRAPTACRPRRGVRAQHPPGEHRDDGRLLRDEGRGAPKCELAGLGGLGHEGRHRPDTGDPRRQPGVRRAGRPRFQGGARKGPALDRARPRGRRDLRQRRMAHPARALPRVVGRRPRARRHDQRRTAVDPAPVRGEIGRRSAGAAGRPARTARATTSSAKPGSRFSATRSSTRSGRRCCTTECWPGASFPKSRRAPPRGSGSSGRSRSPQAAWKSCSFRHPRFTTVASRTMRGCRSCPIRSPRSRGTTPPW